MLVTWAGYADPSGVYCYVNTVAASGNPFSSRVTVSSGGTYISSINVGDVNNDGFMDILAAVSVRVDSDFHSRMWLCCSFPPVTAL